MLQLINTLRGGDTHDYNLVSQDKLYSTQSAGDMRQTDNLGVWMDSALKFSMQCSKAANKAMQALGQIKRTFKHITPVFFNFIQNIHQASFGILYTSLESIFSKGY